MTKKIVIFFVHFMEIRLPYCAYDDMMVLVLQVRYCGVGV